MVTIPELVAGLERAGIFDYYLPFFILFAIFYALLTKSQIFGDPKEPTPRKVNLVVSFAASLFILYYIATNIPTVFPLSQYLGGLFGQSFVIIMTLIAITMVGFVLLTPLGVPMQALGGMYLKYVLAIFIIIGIVLFVTSGGLTYFLPSTGSLSPLLQILSWEQIGIILLIIFTFIIIYWLFKAPPSPPPSPPPKKGKEEG
jgi:hypothetical protein